MKTILTLVILATAVCTVNAEDDLKQTKPLIQLVSEKVSTLAEDGGFSDEDAISAAKMFFVGLVGEPGDNPLTKNAKLRTRIQKSSTPAQVTVFVSYDFGKGYVGYNFRFSRGDVSEGKRWAHFNSLELVPSK